LINIGNYFTLGGEQRSVEEEGLLLMRSFLAIKLKGDFNGANIFEDRGENVEENRENVSSGNS